MEVYIMYKQISEELLSFIRKSRPLPCGGYDRSMLKEADYQELKECEAWNLQTGGKYFTTRNGSSVIAFSIGKELDDYHFQIAASHSDSPTQN